jgi:hypothetical protein
MNPQQSGPVSYNSSSHSGGGVLTTVVLVILLIGALGFGGWAFTSMQDYKNNSDKKAAVAVAAAEKVQAAQLQASFDQQSASPNKSFNGSPTYGSIGFNYPKTWSAYVDTSNISEPINAYFHPNEVPGIQSKTAYALRLELLSTDYSQVIQQLSSQITTGTITAKAYLPPKLAGVTNVQPGTLFSGQVNIQDPNQKGTLLAIKVRDKTLEISTQSNDYLTQFTSIVLASLTFAP